MATFADLITRATRRLSMVPGLGTQIYAEDVIADIIQQRFNMLYKQAWWPQFMSWQTWTLDGTTGRVTDTITSLLKGDEPFEDIRAIWPTSSDTDVPLPRLPGDVVPTTLTGTEPYYYEPDNTKIFRILPTTATGTLELHVRTRPDDFTDDSTVDFNAEVLVFGACWDYVLDDGTNPEQAENFRMLYEGELHDYKARRNTDRVPLNATSRPYIPNSWWIP